MNHPTQNEWLLYLDGEASPNDTRRLLEHLEQCPMCAAEVTGWKRSVQKLQRMSFPLGEQVQPERRADPHLVSWAVKWGLAAAVVLSMGFGLGRLSDFRTHATRQAEAAQVRAELRLDLRGDLLAALDPEHEVKDEFQKQLRLEVQSAQRRTATQNARAWRDAMQVMQQQRQQDQQRFLALIKDVRDQQISDCLALRQDLETAVSTADTDLRQDSRRINQLADTLLTVRK